MHACESCGSEYDTSIEAEDCEAADIQGMVNAEIAEWGEE